MLVEAHDDAEVDRALAAGAGIVGVNDRDLATFAEDLGVGERLAARIPARRGRGGRERDALRRRRASDGCGRVRRRARRRGARAQPTTRRALVAATSSAADGRDREVDDVTPVRARPDQIPTAWFNVAARPRRSRCSRRCIPATSEPVGPDDLAPLFPMAPHRAGGVGRPVDRHPGRGARHPAAVAADAARAGRAARGGARHAGAHLLQGRVGLAGGLAQAQHRGAAGVLQQGRGHRRGSRPRPAPASGGPRCRSRARSSTSSARSTWCASSYEQKPYRRVHDGDVGERGRPVAGRRPDHPGSLGLAISDAVRDAVGRDDTHYSLGSVLNHVLLHQTIIGLEAKEQLALAGETRPDVVIGSLRRRVEPRRHRAAVRDRRATCACVAVEPSSCPTLTEGRFDYDFGDTAGMTPLLPMYTLGHEFMPPSIHAGGLRYHGDSPIISQPGAERADGGGRLPAGQDVRGRGAVRHAPRARSPRPRPATRSGP